MYSFFWFGVLLILLAPYNAFSLNSASDFERVLIRNVKVIDREGIQEDAIVSILIVNKKLSLVTRDEVPREEVDIAFDAKQGIVMGNLKLGTPASFMILNQDPRENLEILLDTKAYTVFAMINGEIELNLLTRQDDDRDEIRMKNRGWLAYAPPPIALPISYQNARKWNYIQSKPINILITGAMILENTRWLKQNDSNFAQVGDIDDFDGGVMRAFRAGAIGTINFKNPWTYMIYVATSAFERGFTESNKQEIRLYDFKVDIPIGNITMSLGKQKETISIDRLLPLMYITGQQERASVLDGILPARNFGVVFNGNMAGNKMSWAGGVFNSWLDDRQAFNESSTVLTGRLTGIPYLSENESSLIHLAIAGRYSNARGGIRHETTTEIFNGPSSVDTDLFEADGAFTLDLEVALQRGPLQIAGEIITSNINSAVREDPSYSRYYVTASYILTGEMRKYNKRNGTFGRIPVAKPVSSGGWGSWDVFTRWSEIDLTDQIHDGGKMGTFSTGINWWPLNNIFANVNYRYSVLDRFDAKGNNHGLVVRLGLLLD